MIRRNTQEPSYWENFRVTDEDLEHLSNVLVEGEIPLSLEEMARALVDFACRREEQRIANELSKGTLYLPKNTYQVGETVVFPLLDYASGKVTAIRDGRNPEYGSFRVIEVAFPQGAAREFAAELADHSLNQPAPQSEGENLLAPDDLYERYGAHVRTALNARLESSPAFIRLANRWFLRDLLVEVNQGHLNLAEAALDMAGGGPLPTEALMDHLDFSKEVKRPLGIFSLNYALHEDPRFDEVGPAGQVLWYLRRLEPPEVLDPPACLHPQVVEYDHRLLDETMLNLERTLGDEWSELVAVPEAKEPVTLTLTYPHRRSGTLPLSLALSGIFPVGRTHRIRFIFRDKDTGEEMEGWVVRERRFVYGLRAWYERYELPVGAYIEISRAPEPGVVLIRRRAIRTRREWVRVATVANGRLTFEMSRFPLSCEADDLQLIAIADLGTLDELARRVNTSRLSLREVVAEILPELAKLSPQGMIHAATLYSAVNMALRTPPGPLLATLASDERYISMGNNYWASRSRGPGF